MRRIEAIKNSVLYVIKSFLINPIKYLMFSMHKVVIIEQSYLDS